MKRTLLSMLLVCRAAMPQETHSSDDHEMIQQLVKRVQYLEAQVNELSAGLAAAKGVPVSPVQQPGAGGLPPVNLASVPPQQRSGVLQDLMSHDVPSGLPAMQVRGFGDLQYAASDRKGATNSFALGQFNIFITSKLSDRFSVLAETVVEAEENFGPRPISINNEASIELERLLLTYTAGDYLNLSFGRYHSAIGFYNTAYHHSTWLQTATDRPAIFAFEDQGGILPIHNVGVTANGRIPSGRLGLRYVAEIGNGRASRSLLDEPVQNVHDENNGKSFNLALLARPDWIQGFQAGFSVYRDRLTPAAAPRVSETIMAAHAVYQTPKWEFLNEMLLIRHAIPGRVLRTPAFYVQASRQFGRFRPFFRYQYLNAPGSDPVLFDIGRQNGPSAGLRYDLSEFAAYKIQYDRTDRNREQAVNGLTTQLSFTF